MVQLLGCHTCPRQVIFTQEAYLHHLSGVGFAVLIRERITVPTREMRSRGFKVTQQFAQGPRACSGPSYLKLRLNPTKAEFVP